MKKIIDRYNGIEAFWRRAALSIAAVFLIGFSLVACTAGDKQIIGDFTQPAPTQQTTLKPILDPSVVAEQEREKATPTPTATEPVEHTYTVKLYGKVATSEGALIFTDGHALDTGYVRFPMSEQVQSTQGRVAVLGVTLPSKHAKAYCTIRDESGKTVIHRAVKGKSKLVSCIYDASEAE